jgi:hypothetical protein
MAMPSESQDTSQKRRWKIVMLLLVVATAAITGEFIRRRSEKSIHATQLEKIEAEVARSNARLELTDEQKAKRLERAKFLRAKWRVWASAHKAELKRMLNAQPDDHAAMKAVWDAIPVHCDQRSTGFTAQDLLPTDDTLYGEVFTWNAIEKAKLSFAEPPKPAEQERLSRSQSFQTAMQLENFKQLRDVEISQSVNKGKSTLSLWASGRVTERRLIGGRPTLLSSGIKIPPQETQEIVPVYDFLKD